MDGGGEDGGTGRVGSLAALSRPHLNLKPLAQTEEYGDLNQDP